MFGDNNGERCADDASDNADLSVRKLEGVQFGVTAMPPLEPPGLSRHAKIAHKISDYKLASVQRRSQNEAPSDTPDEQASPVR
jgi:hypothetical protein